MLLSRLPVSESSCRAGGYLRSADDVLFSFLKEVRIYQGILERELVYKVKGENKDGAYD